MFCFQTVSGFSRASFGVATLTADFVFFVFVEMREDLKGQNLTFTEIAKLVGENWQNLGRSEKAPFEKQANEAKEAYNHALAEYKQTPECKKYNEYLREFRKRQAAQTQGIQPHHLPIRSTQWLIQR